MALASHHALVKMVRALGLTVRADASKSRKLNTCSAGVRPVLPALVILRDGQIHCSVGIGTLVRHCRQGDEANVLQALKMPAMLAVRAAPEGQGTL